MIRLITRIVLAVVALFVLPVAVFAQTKSVTLAVQPSADIPQVLLAIDRSMWKAQSLDVKVVTFASGREALEALLGGQADFAVLTDYPAAIAAVRGQKFQVLADISRYSGLRAIASKKSMTFGSFKDLNGKKVGTTLGTNAEYTTYVMLQEGGAKAEAVNAAPADTVPALVRGDIQAAVMFPTLYGQAKKLLGADYQEVKTKAYVGHTLLVGTTAVVTNRPAETEAFVKGLLEADKIVAADPKPGQAAIISALKGVMTPEGLADLWPDYEDKLVLKQDVVDLMAKEAAWILERGFVKAPIEVTTLKSLRGYFAEGPLARLSPEAVSLAK